MSSASGDASYKKAVRGKLQLKGGKSLKAKKSKSSSSSKHGTKRKREGTSSSASSKGPKQTVAEKVKGTGRIITTGDTVRGTDTKFLTELKMGDAIEVFHPTSLKSEVRVIRMVLSDISLAINSPFSSDLISNTQFTCLRLPREIKDEEDLQREETERKKEEEKSAFGTYASQGGEVLRYRVKKSTVYGGYKIVEEKVSNSMSREALLDARSKHKADRLCM